MLWKLLKLYTLPIVEDAHGKGYPLKNSVVSLMIKEGMRLYLGPSEPILSIELHASIDKV
jgi:hypothetical protein